MATSTPVALILGAGPNVGLSVARAFAEKGYKIALASRRSKESESTSAMAHITGDLSDPTSVAGIFSKAKELVGIPSVVVYNAGAVKFTEADSPESAPIEDFSRVLNINTVSAYAAAQQAVLGFNQLPESASKTFIFTGNALNTIILPKFVTAGAGKAASAHIVESLAAAHQDRASKFYYADERTANGKPVYMDIDGDAHAKHYIYLAEGKTQMPWQQTFVKGIGYRKFQVEAH